MTVLAQSLNFLYLPGGWKDALRQWEKKVEKAIRMPKEEEPPLKMFKPVNLNIPVLAAYEGVLGEEYWGKWTKNP